jgi:hypothetical protein
MLGRLYSEPCSNKRPAGASKPMISMTENQPEPTGSGILNDAISKDDLNKLPIRAYEGPIRVVNDRDLLEECVALLAAEPILGFDTETRPAFVSGVSYPPALMQVATRSEVFVFQLQALGGLGALRTIMENPALIKAGVALTDDIKQLHDCWSFAPQRFVDLGIMAKELGLKQTGLRSLAGLLMGFRISKKEQRSNWAKPVLTRSQIVYAATDAWVSRELYLRIRDLWGDRAELPDINPMAQADEKTNPHSRRSRRRRNRRDRALASTPPLPGFEIDSPEHRGE